MHTTIKDVRVWYDTAKPKDKREYRVYVHMLDGREGCLYRTGNHWHPKASIEGKLTEAEWQQAREIAFYDNCWHTVYESELHGTIDSKPVSTSRRYRCPDCGSYDCGPNCEVNRW